MSIQYQCGRCRRAVAREDRRRTRQGFLQALPPARLELKYQQAPRVRCGCGRATVLLKGRQ